MPFLINKIPPNPTPCRPARSKAASKVAVSLPALDVVNPSVIMVQFSSPVCGLNADTFVVEGPLNRLTSDGQNAFFPSNNTQDGVVNVVPGSVLFANTFTADMIPPGVAFDPSRLVSFNPSLFTAAFFPSFPLLPASYFNSPVAGGYVGQFTPGNAFPSTNISFNNFSGVIPTPAVAGVPPNGSFNGTPPAGQFTGGLPAGAYKITISGLRDKKGRTVNPAFFNFNVCYFAQIVATPVAGTQQIAFDNAVVITNWHIDEYDLSGNFVATTTLNPTPGYGVEAKNYTAPFVPVGIATTKHGFVTWHSPVGICPGTSEYVYHLAF